ncbi:MAG: carboxypeptidase regulatory-like domain-containing protein [Actinobacteria bacterium]|nr:MAG: carboxypeptidase regulatory-like domain-containing protein [Actinomycetota bacterium]
MKKLLSIMLVIVMFLSIAAPVFAISLFPKGQIRGYAWYDVYPNGKPSKSEKPASGIAVYYKKVATGSKWRYGATTGKDGRYAIGVANGIYKVTIKYQTTTKKPVKVRVYKGRMILPKYGANFGLKVRRPIPRPPLPPRPIPYPLPR